MSFEKIYNKTDVDGLLSVCDAKQFNQNLITKGKKS